MPEWNIMIFIIAICKTGFKVLHCERSEKEIIQKRDAMDLEQMKRNLEDAGCDSTIVAEIIRLSKDGRFPEALQKMRMDRCRLMDELHESGRKVDCLDYMIRHTEKKIQADRESSCGGKES